MPNKQGRKWITDKRRLAIYLRDGLTCLWCGKGIVDEIALTLDHYKPRHSGGGNESTNLFTACHECNTSRGSRSVRHHAALQGANWVEIMARIYRTRKRSIRKHLVTAQQLLGSGWSAALQTLKTKP